MIFNQSWYRCIPMVMIMGIIFFLSQQTGDSVDLPDIPDIDKILHSLIYGTLAAATMYAVPGRVIRAFPVRTGVLVVLFCALYGLSDEWHQSFIEGRFPSGWDIAADTFGAMVVVFLWIKLRSRFRPCPSSAQQV